jgi:hypothetical protein
MSADADRLMPQAAAPSVESLFNTNLRPTVWSIFAGLLHAVVVPMQGASAGPVGPKAANPILASKRDVATIAGPPRWARITLKRVPPTALMITNFAHFVTGADEVNYERERADVDIGLSRATRIASAIVGCPLAASIGRRPLAAPSGFVRLPVAMKLAFEPEGGHGS